MTYQLVSRSGPVAGNIYKLERQELFIGRDLNNDIVINDPEVSRRHTRLFLKGSTYVVEDLGSTNGTTVNGQRLLGPYSLIPGAIVTLGENITFVYEEEPTSNDAEATMVASHDINATIKTGGITPPVQQAFGVQAPPIQSSYVVPPRDPEPYNPPFVPQEPSQPPAYVPEPRPYSEYAGQIPNQPIPTPPPAKKKFPIWLIIIILVILCLCCVVVIGGSLYYIDSDAALRCQVLPFLYTCP